MSRVGVLGGTFDPPHFGHLRAAEVVRDALSLDQVLFVPAANPPHKLGDAVTDAARRVSMLEEALAGERHFDICPIEVERGGPSYTIDTLDELRRMHRDTDFWFITGSDAFVEIQTWHRWEDLLAGYSFVVHERPGTVMDVAAAAVPAPLSERVVFLRRQMLNVSSSAIRSSVRDGESIRFLVPESVAEYIKRSRLYA